MKYNITDTRAYSEDKNKNELLFYVEQIVSNPSGLNQQVAQESLNASILSMLENNHYLSLSVALSLAASRDRYQILFNQLNEILLANQDECQFIVLPLIMVLGSKVNSSISLQIPQLEIQPILHSIYGDLIQDVKWYDYIILAEQFSQIKAHHWYQAKTNPTELLNLLSKYAHEIELTSGHEVRLGFMLGYASVKIKKLFTMDKNMMPIMQFWNVYLMQKNITPFVNPLPITSPLLGLIQGSYIRKKMDLDIFVANSIRHIKLDGFRVAVVVATKEGGKLLIRIQALENKSRFSIYEWELSFDDDLEAILRDLICLLEDCAIDNIRVLKQPLDFNQDLPDFHASLEQAGVNPTRYES